MTQVRKGPVTELREQLAAKSDECKSIQQEHLRALADFENIRKRFERDIDVSRRLALEALVTDLLPVLDNFDRAIQATNTGTTVEGLQKGMELIDRQLHDALRKHGVEEYSCLGSQFDPRKAEAVSFVHTAEQEPGTVVSELSKGYAVGERVLRPAKVVVAKAADKSREPEAAGQVSEVEIEEIEDSDSESNG
jgi:molecular chaperone GrpE